VVAEAEVAVKGVGIGEGMDLEESAVRFCDTIFIHVV
jgi:hypothetical protein